MIIVDLSTSADPMSELDGLADVCTPGTVVLTLGATNDIGLYRRLRAGDITREQFFALTAAATGWKAAKIATLLLLLSIPVLNVAVGALLVAKMIHSGRVLVASRKR